MRPLATLVRGRAGVFNLARLLDAWWLACSPEFDPWRVIAQKFTRGPVKGYTRLMEIVEIPTSGASSTDASDGIFLRAVAGMTAALWLSPLAELQLVRELNQVSLLG